MNAELFNALEALTAEKGISREYMLEKIEAALTSAFRREVGGGENVRIVLDPVKRDMKVIRLMTIVEEVTDPTCEMTQEQALTAKAEKRAKGRSTKIGAIMEMEMNPKNFRRLSASAAKQVIIQGIREAEHSNIIREYEKKHEEVITAIVTKVDDNTGDVVVDTGTSEAVLLRSEQIPGDNFAVGDRLKVFVTEVHRDSHGPVVTLSRTHQGMIRRLMELELAVVKSCDAIYLLHGWEKSAGARAELRVALDHNLEIILERE